jgi:hypothetical protein
MARTEVGAGLSHRIARAQSAFGRWNLRAAAWGALIAAGWAAAAMLLGIFVGYGAVALPPAGAFGIVAVAAAVLMWLAPDIPTVSDKTVRRFFYITIVVFMCVPAYYAVFAPALPEISIRRIVVVPLICLYLLYISTSATARAHFVSVFRQSTPIFIGALGFLAMIYLSIPTSIEPVWSISQSSYALLEWFIPFFVVVSVIKTDDDLVRLLRLICVCAIFVAAVGLADFFRERNLMVDILPQSIYQNLLQDKSFVRMIEYPQYRNGWYRSPSVFGVSLSFGEFVAMVAPLGGFFFLQGTTGRDRILGFVTGLLCLISIFASGSRGGYLALIVSAPVFAGLWVLRERKLNPNSLAAAVIFAFALAFFGAVFTLLMSSHRAFQTVYGNDLDQGSTQGRFDQWHMAMPKILSNPITGHGFANGGAIVGWGVPGEFYSVDSYPLSLVVETGVPSLAFFSLIILGAAWIAGRASLFDLSPRGAMNGAMASALAAFAANRLVLSARENHVLAFTICGMVAVSALLTARAAAAKRDPEVGQASRFRGKTTGARRVGAPRVGKRARVERG